MKTMQQLPSVGKIKEFFPYHRICVIKVFLLLGQCIQVSRSCNLSKCSEKAGICLQDSKVEEANIYAQFIRFFKIKCIDVFCLSVSYLIMSMLDVRDFQYLAIDRTNWKIGKENVNVLFWGLVFPDKSYIPILWEVLDKRGNSNQAERIALLEKFLELWNAPFSVKICLLADREFIGDTWLVTLATKGFDFVIALRDNMYLNLISESLGKDKSLIERYIRRRMTKCGYYVCPIVVKDKTFYYIVVPNTERGSKYPYKRFIATFEQVENVQAAYTKRWKIEVFFKHVKSNGYNLEDMNLKKNDKIALMMATVSFLFVLAIINGEIIANQNPIPRKKCKNGQTWNAISLFRLGYKEIQAQAITLDLFVRLCQKAISINYNFQQKLYDKLLIPKLFRKSV